MVKDPNVCVSHPKWTAGVYTHTDDLSQWKLVNSMQTVVKKKCTQSENISANIQYYNVESAPELNEFFLPSVFHRSNTVCEISA